MTDKRKSKQLSNAAEIVRMKQFMVYLEQQVNLRFNAINEWFIEHENTNVFEQYNNKLKSNKEQT